MEDTKQIHETQLAAFSIGRLGATYHGGATPNMGLALALDMAERRILRLEMALRRAGIEVEQTELPE